MRCAHRAGIYGPGGTGRRRRRSCARNAPSRGRDRDMVWTGASGLDSRHRSRWSGTLGGGEWGSDETRGARRWRSGRRRRWTGRGSDLKGPRWEEGSACGRSGGGHSRSRSRVCGCG